MGRRLPGFQVTVGAIGAVIPSSVCASGPHVVTAGYGSSVVVVEEEGSIDLYWIPLGAGATS